MFFGDVPGKPDKNDSIGAEFDASPWSELSGGEEDHEQVNLGHSQAKDAIRLVDVYLGKERNYGKA